MKEGWQVKKLGEVCEFVRGPFGGSLKKNCFKDKGYVVYEQQHAIYNDFTFRYYIEESKFNEMKRFEVFPNDIIMSCSGTMGKISIVPSDAPRGIINQALLKLTVNKYLLNTFLKYWMESDAFQDELSKYSKGAAIKNVASVKILKDISIPIPPLSEQQRIVGILDNAFVKIDAVKQNAERNRDNAKELFQSVLSLAMSSQEKWIIQSLGNICHLITDGKHGDCRNKENSGYYFLSAKDVKNETLNYENARQIEKVDFEETHRRTNLQPNDVLITNSGTIGRMAIASNDPKTYRTTFQKSVAVIKPKSEILNSRFCCFHLQANLSKLMNISAGAAQKNLLLGDLRKYQIHYPDSLSEQQQIVSKLDAFSEKCKELENNYQQTIDSCDELKKAILAKAFNGEL